jgi:hypothetical protein
MTTRASPRPGLEQHRARPVMKDTTLWSQDALQCIVDVMRTLRFPRPARGTMTVVYPIRFTPWADP